MRVDWAIFPRMLFFPFIRVFPGLTYQVRFFTWFEIMVQRTIPVIHANIIGSAIITSCELIKGDCRTKAAAPVVAAAIKLKVIRRCFNHSLWPIDALNVVHSLAIDHDLAVLNTGIEALFAEVFNSCLNSRRGHLDCLSRLSDSVGRETIIYLLSGQSNARSAIAIVMRLNKGLTNPCRHNNILHCLVTASESIPISAVIRRLHSNILARKMITGIMEGYRSGLHCRRGTVNRGSIAWGGIFIHSQRSAEHGIAARSNRTGDICQLCLGHSYRHVTVLVNRGGTGILHKGFGHVSSLEFVCLGSECHHISFRIIAVVKPTVFHPRSGYRGRSPLSIQERIGIGDKLRSSIALDSGRHEPSIFVKRKAKVFLSLLIVVSNGRP